MLLGSLPGNAAHLNAAVLWTTVYLNAALEQLKAELPGPRRRQARLSPFVRKHLGARNLLLRPPDLEPGAIRGPGAIRELRDPDAPDEEEDWPG